MGDSLELQGGNVARKAGHNAGHFPRSHAVPGSPYSTAFGDSVVLLEPTNRVGRGADIEAGVANGGSKQITAVKGGEGPIQRHRKGTRVKKENEYEDVSS
jgi:hypothetical protein